MLCKRHNVFTKEINKIALCSNYDKRMQSIDSTETYACGTSKDLVSEKEDITYNNLNNAKMINFGDVTTENIKKHNPNWPKIPNHSYRILITGGSGSRKTKSLFNPINWQTSIDKTRFYTKDPFKAKYQFLIIKQGSAS